MTTRRFTCDDLFTFNNVNLDYFTETVRDMGVGDAALSHASTDVKGQTAQGLLMCAVQPPLLPAVPGQLARVLHDGGGPRAAGHGVHPGQGGGPGRELARACDSAHRGARVQVLLGCLALNAEWSA